VTCEAALFGLNDDKYQDRDETIRVQWLVVLQLVLSVELADGLLN